MRRRPDYARRRLSPGARVRFPPPSPLVGSNNHCIECSCSRLGGTITSWFFFSCQSALTNLRLTGTLLIPLALKFLLTSPFEASKVHRAFINLLLPLVRLLELNTRPQFSSQVLRIRNNQQSNSPFGVLPSCGAPLL